VNGDQKPTRVLANADAVISLLAEQGPTSPADIAEATGVARSSVYRLVEGLAAVGWTDILQDSRVQLSMRWLRLADAVAPAMPEWAGAQAVLGSVAEATSQTAFLTVRRTTGAVCIAWAQGRGIDLLELKPGRVLPFHAGAAGRTILAHSPDIIDAVLAQAPRPRLTEKTLHTEQQLREDITRSLADGFTVSDEDVTIGIGAIGVPIIARGSLVGCLSVGGLSADIRSGTPGIVTVLTATAHELAAGHGS
jgi:DNA-binding IclR family transcriptional regulator